MPSPKQSLKPLTLTGDKIMTKTLLITALAAMAFVGPTSAAPIAYDFGTMNTTGDGTTGWSFNQGGANSNDNGSPDLPAFFLRSEAGKGYFGLGTSNGDLLAAGDYTISYKYAPYVTSGASLSFALYAWDGSTQTLLTSQDPTDPATLKDWNTFQMDFSLAEGSPLIGQQLQFSVTADGAAGFAAWDTITGTFDAVPEPGSLALLGLGGLLVAARRRRD